MTNRGKLIVVSAPSGAGKTTIVRYLLGAGLNLEFSVSACSRAPRPGEKNGKDYYFISKDEFREKIDNKEFLEWEEVYPGSYYGTLLSELEKIWNSGKHVIFDVDVVGGLKLKEKLPERCLSIFIMPPSVEELEKRLMNRSTEKDTEIEKRIGKAVKELGYSPKFDAIIVNTDLEKAKSEAKSLVRSYLAN